MNLLKTLPPVLFPLIAASSEARTEASGLLPPTPELRLIHIFVALAITGLLGLSYLLRRGLKEKVAAQKEARKELLERTELLRLATGANQAGIWDFHPSSGDGYMDEQWYAMLGYPPLAKKVSISEYEGFIHPDDLPAARKAFTDYLRSDAGSRFEAEFRLRKADGGWCWTLAKGMVVERDDGGNPSRVIGLNLNIQSLKEARKELGQSEARFRAIFEKAPMPLVEVLLDGKTIEPNDRFVQTVGYTARDIPNLDRWWEVAYPDPDYRERVISNWQARVDRARAEGTSVEETEYRVTCRDGTVRDMVIGANVVGDAILISFYDITDRKREEAARLESMELLRATLNATTDGILVVDKGRRITQVNRRFFDLWRIPPDLRETDDDEKMLAYVSGMVSDPYRFLSKVRALYQSQLDDLDEIRLKDGRVFERYSSPMILGGDEIGRVWDFRDISERKRAEEAIDRERRQLLSVFDSLDELIYVSDPFTYEILFANRSLQDRFGKDLVGKLCHKALQGLDRPCDFCTNGIILNNGGVPYRWVFHNPVTDIDVEIVDQIIRWPDGRDVRLEFAKDITTRKRAEEEREKLQGQLLQSRKLEAVGTLAGGVAHDFNNMLGVIIGYAELMLGRMDSGDPQREDLGKILDAAQKSSTLTRQLLAFARRQAVAPVVLDLNESVEGTLKMLRRLIGENIALAWMPCAGPCRVKMDPSQLDQLLANLCVNARDAIGEVGRITIETGTILLDEAGGEANDGLAPGEYVTLAVGDDGCGMDRETLEHIFEPFFTTKALGQGTGLGLATVYGIVKQNQGSITVCSEPGKGSTFRICLPRHAGDAGPVKAADGEVPLGRGENVLLVEDDPMLLEMGKTMLHHLGYTVVPAATPGEAIRIAKEDGRKIDLVITDVVMPEMNGKELSERLLEVRPGVKQLFMSGYTADVIAHRGVVEEGINFMKKPFSMKDLAGKVREVLG
jgi:PAS domain S-box-containing protein